jgi:hypothetical protein
MTDFSAALRDALLVANPTASEDAVRQVVINQLRELDPAATLRSTGYFNHSWVPDLSMRWSDGVQRHLFLRFNVSDPSFVDDMRYADDERDPVFLDIAQPELALHEALGTATEPPATGGIDLGGLHAMVTEHTAWGTLGAGVSSNPDVRNATQQLVRGGRGYVDQPVAAQVVSSYEQAAGFLEQERVRSLDPAALREVLDVLEAPLSRVARLDLETELRARWVRGGRAPELFPSLEGFELHDRSAEEIATLVMALLASEEPVPEERWREIARAISLDALGAATRGRQRAIGGKVNELVRAGHDVWTARWAYVPSYGDARPSSGVLDWSLGGTSLELNLDTHRAVFVDNGTRLNTLAKTDELPYLEPRLGTLDSAAVRGITLVTTDEMVGVQLTATATETLGERLRRLMAEQADVRISGRIARLEVEVPGTNTSASLNFETGRVRAEHPLPIATFARLVAQFMVDLPEERLPPA